MRVSSSITTVAIVSLITLLALLPSHGAPKQDSFGVWLQINHNQSFDRDLKDIRFYKGVMIGKSWSEVERAEGVTGRGWMRTWNRRRGSGCFAPSGLPRGHWVRPGFMTTGCPR